MNFCPKCGTSVKAGTRFCPNCGFDLQVKGATSTPAASAPVQSAPQPQVQPQAQPQPQPQVQFQQQATMAAPMPQAAGNGAIDYQSNLGLFGAFSEYMKEYVKFDGRMSRANYWWAYLAISIISVIALILSYAMGSFLLTNVVVLLFLVPSYSSMSRRLHDSNLSGGNIFWILLPVAGAIYLLVLLCKPADQQANRFG
ncbi:DUF805 domain-containing protein [Levilactobacillus humaensis]|uniref:DUF805 domain-containing protein n=1 Tax=Levilactobacillus humaensis TaxID=2950375 RepID=UPI0021C46E14|nr:DUF805 domain-containing protein [Levilactobacillus humaensis]